MHYLPIYCFPNVSWLKIASSDEVILDCHEYYVKQTLRNRIEILGANGVQKLTIPVESQKGEKMSVKDIRIAHHEWRKLHLTSIRSAYGRAPYFEYYFEEIETIFLKKQNFLVDFNLEAIEWLRSKKLKIAHRHSAEYIPYNMKPIAEGADFKTAEYFQVFSDRFPFASNLSAIDLLMNLGPRVVEYLDIVEK